MGTENTNSSNFYVYVPILLGCVVVATINRVPSLLSFSVSSLLVEDGVNFKIPSLHQTELIYELRMEVSSE